jgi:phage terminase large subunit
MPTRLTPRTHLSGHSRLWRIEGERRVARYSCETQRAFVHSKAPDNLFTGGWGAGGKSIGLGFRAFLLSMLYPNNIGAFCRKVRADMETSSIPKLRAVVGEELWVPGVVGGQNDPDHLYFPNGSRIDFLGFDRKEKFLSADYGHIEIDECNEVTEDDWEFAAYRLRLHDVETSISGSCNPDSPAHFLYSKFEPDDGTHQIFGMPEECERCRGQGEIERWFTDDDNGQVWAELGPCTACNGQGAIAPLIAAVFVAEPEENAQNLPSHYVARKKRLTGIRRLRYYDGKWVAFAGLVYDSWQRTYIVKPEQLPAGWLRVADHHVPPASWPRYRGIDFGYTAPFVCQWWARDPEGTWWLYREIYMTQRTVRRHAETIKALEDQERAAIADAWLEREQEKYDVWEWARTRDTLTPPRPRFLGTYADTDAEDRATLEEHGYPSIPALKEKRPGIETVHELILTGKVRILADALHELDFELENATGKPPTHTVQEFGKYLWLPKAEGRAVKEDTVPDNDHGMDAMRYVLHTHAQQGEVRFLELRGDD